MARNKQKQYAAAIEKELKTIKKQEESLRKMAEKAEEPRWKQTLESKVPEQACRNLQQAFCKAFSMVFSKGTAIIEQTYNRNDIEENHQVQNFAFQVKADRKTLLKIRGSAGIASLKNMAITTAEGIGLGMLGIGLPDIVVFVGVLLKGMYEIALHYGFDYDSEEERYFILKLMETAMLKTDAWVAGNGEIDWLIEGGFMSGTNAAASDRKYDVERQISRTAELFAMDMVLLKFVQGLPLVGVVGGVGNPLYYGKVIKYAELKYRKRYLCRLWEVYGSAMVR